MRLKLSLILFFLIFGIAACVGGGAKSGPFVIATSKSYEASLYRQNCAICHGAEAEGKTLSDGTVVPSLREGEFKFRTQPQIHKQIADGGNGMLPFRRILSDKEINMLSQFVHRDLRGGK